MQRRLLLTIFAGLAIFCLAAQADSPTAAYNFASLPDEAASANFVDRVIPLAAVASSEADPMQEKKVWRVIDTREKKNLVFRDAKQPLIYLLLEGIAQGNLTAYSPEDQYFNLKMTKEDVGRDLYQRDSIWVTDQTTGETQLQLVANTFNPDAIKRWQLQEIWYFDEQQAVLRSRIMGIAPLVETFDKDGQPGEDRPLFWISYEQARPWLARFSAARFSNDYAAMNWEDLFEVRAFDSYVIKEGNTFDRRLDSYVTGPTLLYEAKDMDETLYELEVELWEH